MLPIAQGCSTGLFEVNDSLCQFSHVYAARSIVEPKQEEVPLRLVNLSYNTVTLGLNVNIGKVISIRNIATLLTSDNKST